jgi:hypothetical protein
MKRRRFLTSLGIALGLLAYSSEDAEEIHDVVLPNVPIRPILPVGWAIKTTTGEVVAAGSTDCAFVAPAFLPLPDPNKPYLARFNATKPTTLSCIEYSLYVESFDYTFVVKTPFPEQICMLPGSTCTIPWPRHGLITMT